MEMDFERSFAGFGPMCDVLVSLIDMHPQGLDENCIVLPHDSDIVFAILDTFTQWAICKWDGNVWTLTKEGKKIAELMRDASELASSLS